VDHHTAKLIQIERGCVTPYMPFTRPARLVTVAIALAVLVSACGSAGTTAPTKTAPTKTAPAKTAPAKAAPTGATRVTISGYAYQPATLTVMRGAKITFTNHDQTAHTATSNTTGFDSGTIKPGHSASVTVTKAGTYTYYCQFHAFMHGTIIVK
jgi:plastocyanin